MIDHRLHVGAASRRAGRALVADAPGEDARVVGRLLDHLPHHPLREREHGRILHLLLAELPDRDLGHEQDAVAIGVVEDVRMLRVVDRAREHDLEPLHVVPVGPHRPARLGEPLLDRVLVARHAREAHALAVQPQAALADLDAADPERVGSLVQDGARAVAQRQLQRVELRLVEVPEPRLRDGERQRRLRPAATERQRRLAGGDRLAARADDAAEQPHGARALERHRSS